MPKKQKHTTGRGRKPTAPHSHSTPVDEVIQWIIQHSMADGSTVNAIRVRDVVRALLVADSDGLAQLHLGALDVLSRGTAWPLDGSIVAKHIARAGRRGRVEQATLGRATTHALSSLAGKANDRGALIDQPALAARMLARAIHEPAVLLDITNATAAEVEAYLRGAMRAGELVLTRQQTLRDVELTAAHVLRHALGISAKRARAIVSGASDSKAAYQPRATRERQPST